MSTRRVFIHCNASVETGMGHLMRSLAVAEEAASRGWDVRIVGDISDAARARATKQQPGVTIESVAPDHLGAVLRTAAHEGTDVVHLDSYATVPDLDGAAALISNMQDGPFGLRRADLAIDANFGAETWFERPDYSRNHLVGIDATVIRRQVLHARDQPRTAPATPRVLVVMGGTDAQRLSLRIATALAATPSTIDVTIVAPESEHDPIRSVLEGTSHTVTVRTFIDDLPAVARQHNLVISAAGSSVWDFACMGIPMAIICVVDNQRRGYRAAVDAQLAIGLGEPPHTDLAQRIAALPAMIAAPDRLRTQSEYLRRVVDGKGVWRIVSAWEALSATDPTISSVDDVAAITARRAQRKDAQTLFDWRNDDTTRSHSRSTAPLSWDTHIDWIDRSLADPNRILLIVQDDDEDIATVRWDKRAEHDWEVSITLAPSHRGRGLSTAVLAAGEGALDIEKPLRMLASINTDNTASKRLFQRAGYLPHLPADENGFETRAKWRLTSAN